MEATHKITDLLRDMPRIPSTPVNSAKEVELLLQPNIDHRHQIKTAMENTILLMDQFETKVKPALPETLSSYQSSRQVI